MASWEHSAHWFTAEGGMGKGRVPNYHANTNMTTPRRETDCPCHQEGGWGHAQGLESRSPKSPYWGWPYVRSPRGNFQGVSFQLHIFQWDLTGYDLAQFKNKWALLETLCSLLFGVFLAKVSCASGPAKVGSRGNGCVKSEVGLIPEIGVELAVLHSLFENKKGHLRNYSFFPMRYPAG